MSQYFTIPAGILRGGGGPVKDLVDGYIRPHSVDLGLDVVKPSVIEGPDAVPVAGKMKGHDGGKVPRLDRASEALLAAEAAELVQGILEDPLDVTGGKGDESGKGRFLLPFREVIEPGSPSEATGASSARRPGPG